jgi:hypothetical protein
MTTLNTYKDLSEALADFAKNNSSFPDDFVRIKMDTEVMETVEGENYCLDYRATDDRLTLDQDIDYPCTWDEFEIQLAEFWDLIDFWEKPVEEVPPSEG